MTVALWILIATHLILLASAGIWLWWVPRLVANTVATEVRRLDDRIEKRLERKTAATVEGQPTDTPRQLGKPSGDFPAQPMVAGQSLKR